MDLISIIKKAISNIKSEVLIFAIITIILIVIFPDQAIWILGAYIIAILTYFIFKTISIKKNITPGDKSMIPEQEEEKGKNLEKLQEYIKHKETITNDEVEEFLDISHATATRYLDDLENKDLIEQIGEEGRGVYYKIK